MLVLLISVLVLGAPVGLAAAAGVLAVTAGVLLVRGIGGAAADLGSLALALAVGACIAGYTLVDDRGIRHAGALPYFEIVLIACALPYAAVIAATRGTAALRAAADRRAAAAGVGMVTAYLLVLAALERAEAAPVAALRETSVVMAAAGAAIIGREKVPARRLAGAVLVVARRRRDRPRLKAGTTGHRARTRPSLSATRRPRPHVRSGGAIERVRIAGSKRNPLRSGHP